MSDAGSDNDDVFEVPSPLAPSQPTPPASDASASSSPNSPQGRSPIRPPSPSPSLPGGDEEDDDEVAASPDPTPPSPLGNGLRYEVSTPIFTPHQPLDTPAPPSTQSTPHATVDTPASSCSTRRGRLPISNFGRRTSREFGSEPKRSASASTSGLRNMSYSNRFANPASPGWRSRGE